MATKFRTRIGESLATVEQHDAALPDVITPSLEALKAYDTGQSRIRQAITGVQNRLSDSLNLAGESFDGHIEIELIFTDRDLGRRRYQRPDLVDQNALTIDRCRQLA